MVLEAFSPAVREWFAAVYPAPTPAQAEGWPGGRPAVRHRRHGR